MLQLVGDILQINPNIVFGYTLVYLYKRGVYTVDVAKMDSHLIMLGLRLNAVGYTVSCTQTELRIFLQKYRKYYTYTTNAKLPSFIDSIVLKKTVDIDQLEKRFCLGLTESIKEIMDTELNELVSTMGW